MTRFYLDANASEVLRPEAARALAQAFALHGNPASVHAAGRAARAVVEDARDLIAARFGAAPARLIFVSGGTEADALAIAGLRPGRRVVAGATEHDAVRAAAPDAEILPVAPDGTVRLDALEATLRRDGRALVCLMHANNETGVLHPVREAAMLCRAHGALLHVDAAQAAGRIATGLAATGAHSLALSAHKLGGPAGIGALLLDPEAAAALHPLMIGGGQEGGRRGGTQPVALIAAFAAAVAADTDSGLAALRDRAECAARACGALVMGAGAPRLPNTTCLALPGKPALHQLMVLDLDGIAVSAGAACSSGKVARSHVLDAMGQGALAGQAIRVSLPWCASAADIDAFVAAYRRLAGRGKPGGALPLAPLVAPLGAPLGTTPPDPQSLEPVP
jgi:cysteine desulfurase